MLIKHLGQTVDTVTGLLPEQALDYVTGSVPPIFIGRRPFFEGEGGGAGGDGGAGGGSGDGGGAGSGSGDGGGNGGGGNADDEKITITKKHLEHLNRENQKHRTRAETLDTELGTAKTKLSTYETAELERKGELENALKKEREDRATERAELTTKTQAAEQKAIRVELRRIAKEAGLIDLSDISDIDVKDYRMDDEGNVPGLVEAIDKLKETKKHWFKTEAEPGDGKGGRRIGTPAGEGSGGGGGGGGSLAWDKMSEGDVAKNLSEKFGIALS